MRNVQGGRGQICGVSGLKIEFWEEVRIPLIIAVCSWNHHLVYPFPTLAGVLPGRAWMGVIRPISPLVSKPSVSPFINYNWVGWRVHTHPCPLPHHIRTFLICAKLTTSSGWFQMFWHQIGVRPSVPPSGHHAESTMTWVLYIDGFMQERRNSFANALELVFLALAHRYMNHIMGQRCHYTAIKPIMLWRGREV